MFSKDHFTDLTKSINFNKQKDSENIHWRITSPTIEISEIADENDDPYNSSLTISMLIPKIAKKAARKLITNLRNDSELQRRKLNQINQGKLRVSNHGCSKRKNCAASNEIRIEISQLDQFVVFSHFLEFDFSSSSSSSSFPSVTWFAIPSPNFNRFIAIYYLS